MNGELCRVYWGSHGCDLPQGHENQDLHICGSADPDGVCSKIEREWVWRFFDEEGGWSRPYPATPFGEDVHTETGG